MTDNPTLAEVIRDKGEVRIRFEGENMMYSTDGVTWFKHDNNVSKTPHFQMMFEEMNTHLGAEVERIASQARKRNPQVAGEALEMLKREITNFKRIGLQIPLDRDTARELDTHVIRLMAVKRKLEREIGQGDRNGI